MGKGKKIIIGAVVLLVAMLAVWQVSKTMTSAHPLTKEEATQKIQELYTGDIVDVQEGSNRYLITIVLETGTYEIEIDRESGDIGSVIRTKKVVKGNEPAPENKIDDSTNESNQSSEEEKKTPEEQGTPPASGNETEKNPEGAKRIPEQEAMEIALNQLDGEVDDIELEQSGDVLYYLVDIEREGSEDEATIKINAISGEVMSVIWDD